METLKKIFSNVWAVVAAVFGILLLALKWQSSKRKEAEAKLDHAETVIKDEKLEADRKVIQAEQKHTEEKKDELNKSLEKAKSEAEKLDSAPKVEDFWKKN